ncbi:MAG: hypothetical protein GX130_03350 [Candidatus Hydrogenedens sp.]|jgi:Tfp pilus assembly protein PilN|nr:hypothetical protein [Candidatus Hydrogenedens sp.]
MIRINLLPKELRPVQRTPIPHIVSLLILAAVLVFMNNVYTDLRLERTIVTSKVDKTNKELSGLQEAVEEHKALIKQKALLQRKILAIQEILEGKTVWSEQLHQLASLTPENIWYKRIRVTSKKFSEEQPAIDRKTGKPVMDARTNSPRMTRVSVDKQILEVSGYAIDDEHGMSSTSTLAARTSNDKEFSSYFELHNSKIGDTDFNGYPVREFTFEYIIGG